MGLPTYQTGKASVAAGAVDVFGTDVMWSSINVKQGDFISIGGSDAVLITEVTNDAQLKIAPWQGAAQTNALYVIYQNYVGRVVGVAAAEDVGDMLERLKGWGPIFNVPPDETEPDPSYGVDGQWAYQMTTGTWWLKTGGEWVESDPPVGGANPSDGLPLMDGVAAPGTSDAYSRDDHIHPTDTSRAPVVHTHTAGQVTDFAEAVDDRVAALLLPGTNITLSYNDAAGSLTINSAGGGGGGGASVTVSDTPPASPTAGNLWWESDTGILYIYYTDPTPNSQWVAVSGGGGTVGRERLTANRTYYVATTGLDSNDGLAVGTPFLTVQKAIDTVAALDCATYNVTISVGAGSFAAGIVLKPYLGSGTMTLAGAGSTTIINGGADAGISAANCGVWNINSLKIISTSYHGLFVAGAIANIVVVGVEFGACGAAHIRSTLGANVRLSLYSISGNAPFHWSPDNKGNITCVSTTVTITGTPAFAGAFCSAIGLCYVWAEAITFSGAATGPRYTVTQGSILYTAGAATTYLPGNAAHATPTATGGQYI